MAGFAPLPLDLLRRLRALTAWPEVADYAKLFPQAPVDFHEQNEAVLQQHGGYEPTVEALRSVPTRRHNWHDFYNALSWELFPKTKWALHRSQIEFRDDAAANKRSPQQNGATLFDECGCILVTCERSFQPLLRTMNGIRFLLSVVKNYWQHRDW